MMRQGVTDSWEWTGITELLVPATPNEVRSGAPLVRFASSAERHALIRRQLVREAADNGRCPQQSGWATGWASR
jgi:hypothetical protein